MTLTVVAEIPSQGVVWTCGLHRKRLTDPLLTWTVGQREEGRREEGMQRGKEVWTEGNMEEEDRQEVANKKIQKKGEK